MQSFDIVDLIENNPITSLSDVYQDRLLMKIKAKFTEQEQQIFVASFYGFLKYDPKNDYVIDLDDVWKWVGFAQKVKATALLDKHFIINKDYILLGSQPVKQKTNTRGGHNKETFMLTIETFKKFCLKAGTKKADEIHDYYIKLEETIHEIVNEESVELKKQLEIKDKEVDKLETQIEKIRERTLLEQFGPNVQCVYYGTIDEVSDTNEKLIKFGNSNNLRSRVLQHKDTYTNFRLMNAFKVENKLQIENAIKEHPLFIEHQRNTMIKGKKYVELISFDGLTYTQLDKTIKEIITTTECSPENYKKLLEENKKLKNEIQINNNINELVLLRNENKHLKKEILKLTKNKGMKTQVYNDTEGDTSIQMIITEKEVENYGIIMKGMKRPRKMKERDGLFHIDGNVYEKIEGTREEVWNGTSYQTAGKLKKCELLINHKGKIVSKAKSIDGKANNKLDEVNNKRRNTTISNDNT